MFAKTKGKLKLKTMRNPIVIVTEKNYEEMMDRHQAHDYIRTFVGEALKHID